MAGSGSVTVIAARVLRVVRMTIGVPAALAVRAGREGLVVPARRAAVVRVLPVGAVVSAEAPLAAAWAADARAAALAAAVPSAAAEAARSTRAAAPSMAAAVAAAGKP